MLMQLLLEEKGADIVAKSETGFSLLHWAGITQLLLNKGVGINVRDRESRTPLYEAAMYGCEAVCVYC
jgi:ankyrin repeat protein